MAGRAPRWCVLTILWVGGWVSLEPVVTADTCDPSTEGLSDLLEVTNGGFQFDVHYESGSCGDSDPDVYPDASAQWVLDGADAGLDLLQALGFRDPYQSSPPDYDILVYDISDGLGVAKATCFRLDAPSFNCDSTDVQMRKTLMHEMHHSTQRNYLCDVTSDCSDDDTSISGTMGKWVAEGTARCLDDRWYSDLDSATFGGSFRAQVNCTCSMSSSSCSGCPLFDYQTSITDLKYGSCLWWSFLCEQLGGLSIEPWSGADFIREFWEQVASNGSSGEAASLSALDQVIGSMSGGDESLESMFRDYAICNYTKDYDISALANSQRYWYVDENQYGEGAYSSVSPTAASIPDNDTDQVNSYGIQYYEAAVGTATCQAVGFRGLAEQAVGWGAVGVTSDGRAVGLAKGQGEEFGRTFIMGSADPIAKIGVIVAGLSNQSDFEYWLDEGPLSVTIERPTSTRPAKPGDKSDPGRFLARVVVEGPADLEPAGVGTRSVLGLTNDDFTVTVDEEAAAVLSAAYVGGEYWLVIDAPPLDDNGFHDLTVSLCDDTVQDTNSNAVVYGDITVNHMVVVDDSGSMGDPPGNSKLNAAQIAAALYVDAVSDGDRVGLVSFNGNDIDCDNVGATLQDPLATATATHRQDIIDHIEALTDGGWTVLGDALLEAQAELTPLTADDEEHTIVLLTDGKGNEATYWNEAAACPTAKSTIEPSRTTIYAIGFGPEVAEDTLNDIWTSTDGDYGYVDVSAGRSASAVGGTGLSMINEISDVYVDAVQHTRRLQRLFFHEGVITGGMIEFDIPVTEANLQDATFYFNVDDRSANLFVELFNPMGVPVLPPMAGIYGRPTHAVFHINGPPMPGNWHARLFVDPLAENVQFIAGLLAENRHGPQLVVRAGQVAGGGIGNEPGQGRFEQGVPVHVVAILTDEAGPILGAEIEIEIEQPNGLPACGVYELRDDGSQADGQPDDGVYGVIFTATGMASRNGVTNDDPQEPPPGPGIRGSYRVRVRASGTSNTGGEPFERHHNTAFHVYASDEDADGDGLPDTWEAHYGTNPLADDAVQDGDLDGLANDMEFMFGTDPFDADSDDDGELDGSEISHGRCPTHPDDGALKAPLDVEILDDIGDEGQVLPENGIALRFPWRPQYQEIRIFRAENTPQDFQLQATVSPTPENPLPVRYDDLQVAPCAVRYFYRLQAVGQDGGVSRFSKILRSPFVDCDANGVHDGCEPDSDGDGAIDACDACPLDNPDDTDGDGVCDSADVCPGDDDTIDTDLDGKPDACDPCPVDNPDDSDGDGVCDSVDPCPLDNPDDSDGDGVCDSVDPCPLDNPDDSDGDGVCDSNDVCPGGDDTVDTDGDGIPDACEGPDCPSDLDGTGEVDSADLAQMLGAWGACVPECVPDPDHPENTCAADLNGDCLINSADLANLLGGWGSCT